MRDTARLWSRVADGDDGEELLGQDVDLSPAAPATVRHKPSATTISARKRDARVDHFGRRRQPECLAGLVLMRPGLRACPSWIGSFPEPTCPLVSNRDRHRSPLDQRQSG